MAETNENEHKMKGPSRRSWNSRQCCYGLRLLAVPRSIHLQRGMPHLLRKIAHAIQWASMALALCVTAPAQSVQKHSSPNGVDRELEAVILEGSAPELVSRYFDLPSIPIFLIRRVANLGDPRVIPALQDAFDRQTRPLTRAFIAATLVRLGETDSRYFDYVAGEATEALNSDIPNWKDSTIAASNDGDLQGSEMIQAWARNHHMSLVDAIYRTMIEIPGAVEALSLTSDHRSVPILLQALHSKNPLIVREAALGLARMHEAAAIQPIIAACKRADREDRPWLAKSLLYFRSKRATEAAGSMIDDPGRLEQWHGELKREEAIHAEVMDLSEAIQGLDRASVQLDQIGLAIKEGDSPGAEAALIGYMREFGYTQRYLVRLPAGKVEDGLAWGVLGRLERQRSELKRLREPLHAAGFRTSEKAESLVTATYQMMLDKGVEQTP